MTGMRHVPVDREAPAAAYLRARQLLREGEVVGRLPRGRDLLLLHGAGADARRRGAGPRDRRAGRAARASGASSGCGASVARWRAAAAAEPAPGPAQRPACSGRRCTSPPTPTSAARRRAGGPLTALLEELQCRPHLRPQPGEHAPWYPAHLGGDAPDRREALTLDRVPRAAVAPTWGPRAPATDPRSRCSGWPAWPAHPSDSAWRRTPSSSATTRSCSAGSRRWSPSEELWTLPGGGLDHGEDPRDAVVREVHEETGLHAEVSDTARVYSAHMPQAWRAGRRVNAHAVRIVYDGWVPPGSPEPRVVEVDGSTIEAAWQSLADVVSGAVPVTPLVVEALGDHAPFQLQRVAAYALVRRGDDVLLTRLSARAAHPGDGRCPAAASTTVSGPPTRWLARWPRSAGWRARSACSSTCTTPTSPAPRRAAAGRTSTASTWSSRRASTRTPSPASPRPGARPTRSRGCRSPMSATAPWRCSSWSPTPSVGLRR